MRVKILILESCRSPEIQKPDTEPIILSKVFEAEGINYELYSNDYIWQTRIKLDQKKINTKLLEFNPGIVHLAVHGCSRGLVLTWSNEPDIGNRKAIDILTPQKIRLMTAFQGRLIASGACESAQLADDFKFAGAKAVVAPSAPVPWARIGLFFQQFYKSYFKSQNVQYSLTVAIKEYPEYNSYQVY